MINAHNKLYRNYLNLDYQIIDNRLTATSIRHTSLHWQ